MLSRLIAIEEQPEHASHPEGVDASLGTHP